MLTTLSIAHRVFNISTSFACRRLVAAFTLLTGSLSLGQLAAQAAPPVDFVRDIQPILAEHCTHCHGLDEHSRQGGLRLDLQTDAFRGGDSGEPAIVSGKPELGLLMQRITSHDVDEVMPPPKENKPLTAKQIETIKQWISEGANYQSHWAFVPPQKIALPQEDSRNPIDQLVSRKLNEQGLELSPKESNSILARRIYLDTIGLPPSIQELDAFERDGLETVLDRLLASDRFGEKWARHWLDAARYSDTNGYEKDLQREQWAWRDWVIQALNRDMLYDQFIVEQIAGDLLPNATQDQVIATGFLRNSMLNEEGAIVPEQFRMFEMFDRIDCIGKAILGLTTQCSQCHTHKFDPLSHDEYYGMFAYLNNTYEAQSWVYNEEQSRKLQEVRSALANIEKRIQESRPQWQSEVEQFVNQVQSKEVEWKPISFHQLEAISGLNHPVQANDQSILMLGHTSGDIFFVGKHELQGTTGIRLEVLPHRDLPFGGPGRNRVGGWNVQELEVFIKRPEATIGRSKSWCKPLQTSRKVTRNKPMARRPRDPWPT